MPSTKPSWSARNFTPSSTSFGSSTLAVAGWVPSVQIEHGHTPVGGAARAVVKPYVYGSITFGVGVARSAAPLTVTVYRVPAVSAADGVKVAARVAVS